jgi:cytosine/adenosine deaminase-related metal-dependent hydrolase
MKREVTISYNWSNDDNTEIKQNHQKALEESAMNRIIEMMREGYTSGELNDNVYMHNDDGEDGIEYRGWWSITTKNVDDEL